MEFNDLEKQWVRDLDKYASAEEIERLDMIFSSAQIDSYEHTMDNSALDTSFAIFLHKMRTNGCNFLGIGKAPWPHHERNMAVVFEDADTFEKYWWHTNDYIIDWWREQILLYQGKLDS